MGKVMTACGAWVECSPDVGAANAPVLVGGDAVKAMLEKLRAKHSAGKSNEVKEERVKCKMFGFLLDASEYLVLEKLAEEAVGEDQDKKQIGAKEKAKSKGQVSTRDAVLKMLG